MYPSLSKYEAAEFVELIEFERLLIADFLI